MEGWMGDPLVIITSGELVASYIALAAIPIIIIIVLVIVVREQWQGFRKRRNREGL